MHGGCRRVRSGGERDIGAAGVVEDNVIQALGGSFLGRGERRRGGEVEHVFERDLSPAGRLGGVGITHDGGVRSWSLLLLHSHHHPKP